MYTYLYIALFFLVVIASDQRKDAVGLGFDAAVAMFTKAQWLMFRFIEGGERMKKDGMQNILNKAPLLVCGSWVHSVWTPPVRSWQDLRLILVHLLHVSSGCTISPMRLYITFHCPFGVFKCYGNLYLKNTGTLKHNELIYVKNWNGLEDMLIKWYCAGSHQTLNFMSEIFRGAQSFYGVGLTLPEI